MLSRAKRKVWIGPSRPCTTPAKDCGKEGKRGVTKKQGASIVVIKRWIRTPPIVTFPEFRSSDVCRRHRSTTFTVSGTMWEKKSYYLDIAFRFAIIDSSCVVSFYVGSSSFESWYTGRSMRRQPAFCADSQSKDLSLCVYFSNLWWKK